MEIVMVILVILSGIYLTARVRKLKEIIHNLLIIDELGSDRAWQGAKERARKSIKGVL